MHTERGHMCRMKRAPLHSEEGTCAWREGHPSWGGIQKHRKLKGLSLDSVDQTRIKCVCVYACIVCILGSWKQLEELPRRGVFGRADGWACGYELVVFCGRDSDDPMCSNWFISPLLYCDPLILPTVDNSAVNLQKSC